jgi:hypothetical protein
MHFHPKRIVDALGSRRTMNNPPIMKRVYETVIDLRPAWIGTGTTVALDHINTAIGILVGLATLIYLILRIRREILK